MQAFRTKPVNVEAIQWVKSTKAKDDTTEDVIRFLDAAYGGESSVGSSINLIARDGDGHGVVVTPNMWIVRDPDGSLTFHRPEAFEQHFEAV